MEDFFGEKFEGNNNNGNVEGESLQAISEKAILMYCDNCGEAIKEKLMFCPACGSKLTEPEKSHKNNPNIRGDVKKVKKKLILIVILVIAVVFAINYFKSPAGRMMVSRVLVSNKQYSKAYDIICTIDTEKADAYEQYVLLMMKGEYLKEAPEEKFEDTIVEIRDSLSELSGKEYLLKDYEVEYLSWVLDALDKYDSEFDNIIKFRDNIHYASNVYEQIEIFKNGETFNANRVKEAAESWQEALESAESYYRSVVYYNIENNGDGSAMFGMEGYDSVLSDIIFVRDEMKKVIEEYEDSSSIYYINGFTYGENKINPYNTETVDRLENAIRRNIIYRHYPLFVY